MLASLRTPGGSPRLLAVGPDGRWRQPEGTGPVDLGEGWWALPGLADAHAHLASDRLDLEPGEPGAIRRRAFACLERGTFLVADKGWRDDSVVMTLTGLPPTQRPDFEGAGRMISTAGGYYPGFAVETDEAGIAAAVEQGVREGKGWVKLVGDWPRKGRGPLANFSPAALATAVEVAHRGGARVAIHTMAPEVASTAVGAGVDSIEHGLFLTAEDLAQLDARNGAWVPTIVRMKATVEMLGADSSGGRLIREGLDNVAALLREVPDGVAVLAGTDLATGSGDVAPEVAALVRCGLAVERAVAAASTGVADYLGIESGFEPGSPADAVFFGADPLEVPSVLADPVAVVRRGERVR
jgi:imidazolonepropionase-like amidohydrolase